MKTQIGSRKTASNRPVYEAMSRQILSNLQEALTRKYGERVKAQGHETPAQWYEIDGSIRIGVIPHQWGTTSKAAFQVNYRKGWIIAKSNQDTECVQRLLKEIEAICEQEKLAHEHKQHALRKRLETKRLLADLGVIIPVREKLCCQCGENTGTFEINGHGLLEIHLCLDADQRDLIRQILSLFTTESK